MGEGLDQRPLPATDGKPFRNVAQHCLPLRLGIVGATLLETDKRLPGDQNAAVQAEKLLAKLLFEMRQRLVK